MLADAGAVARRGGCDAFSASKGSGAVVHAIESNRDLTVTYGVDPHSRKPVLLAGFFGVLTRLVPDGYRGCGLLRVSLTGCVITQATGMLALTAGPAQLSSPWVSALGWLSAAAHLLVLFTLAQGGAFRPGRGHRGSRPTHHSHLDPRPGSHPVSTMAPRRAAQPRSSPLRAGQHHRSNAVLSRRLPR